MKLKNLVLFIVLLLLSVSCNKNNIPVEQQVNSILKQMTLDEKLDYIGGYKGFYIRGIDRLDLPEIKMSDGPMGVRNYGPTTAYPASISIAASWNRKLAEKFGEAMGRDARARGVHIILAPGVDIYRAAFCGRNFEYLGEDPYLASQIVVPIINGIQSKGVSATVKHYIVNNQEFDRHKVSSDVDERTLREIYMPAFKAAVQKGKVDALMTSYNLINGIHASEHDYLVNQVLKKEWGFDGVVMSDWTSTYSTIGVANGGLDLEMPKGKFMNPDSLKPLIESGTVKEPTIDDKVRRILTMIIKNGYQNNDQLDSEIPKDDPKSRAAALKVAEEGTVLLKNSNNILPLNNSKIKSIAVIGPNSDPAVWGGGGSSFTTPTHSVSILEGIKNVAGKNIEISYIRGIRDLSGDQTYANSTFYQSDGSLGLMGEYFDNMKLTGKAVKTQIDEKINFVFRKNPAGKKEMRDFSIRWKGVIKPKNTGIYRLFVKGDDGYRLIVDGDTLINAWVNQPPTARSAVKKLIAGNEYKVTLEYYQDGGGAEINFGFEEEKGSQIDEAMKIASGSDVVILCVGFDQSTEGEGRDRTYELPKEQQDLISKILKANKNTIIVLTGGGNVEMNNWIEKTTALIHAWYPGQEGGTAIAEIIFGKINPSGKLPASFEKSWNESPVYNSYLDSDNDKHVEYTEGLYIGYRYFDKYKKEPRFPFGFGLSYTTFEYSDLNISKVNDNEIKVSFSIKNTGEMAGAEIAQIYVTDSESSVDRPLKELKGFEKVFLNPNETKTVEVTLNKDAFEFYDIDSKSWKFENGEFIISVGASSRDIKLKKEIVL